MVAKSILLSACVASGLMACTTRPDPEHTGPGPVTIPPPEVSIELPLEQTAPPDFAIAQACLLSTTKSCMELDARPFEPCLVTAKECEREGFGVMKITPPVGPAPARK
jgi:hypothetical protein